MSRRVSRLLERAKLKATTSRASSAGRNGWLMLKKVLEDIAEAADMCPPLKTVLKGVVAVMEHVDTVKDVKDDFSKIASRLEGFETIFAQYQSQKDVPFVLRSRLERLSEELVPIGTMIQKKMGQGVTKRMLKALKDVEDVKDIFQTLATLLEKYQIECNLSIELNVLGGVAERLLEKLGHVQHAGIDSQTGDACMKDTRVDLLEDIGVWSRDPDVARIFWLSGMAGTGKSAIARSVCHMLREAGVLGASFFCSRGIRDNVTSIIPTLATSLARQNTDYRRSLLVVLRNEPDIGHYTVQTQVERLLENPLRDAFGDSPPMFVLVVDAMDECLDAKATRSMLSALIPHSRQIPVKFFLTSRPERHIQSQFKSTQRDLHNTLRLHDIERSIVEADIRFYCRVRLKQIRASYEDQEPPHKFPLEWPSSQNIEMITKLAGKLFIYAFTAINYIEEKRPVERLLGMMELDFAPEQPLTGPLDDMYSLVLRNALSPASHTPEEIKKTKHLLTIIVVLRESLSVAVLGELIDMPDHHIRSILDELHAVIYTPVRNDSGAITTFHASFEDYLTAPDRAPDTFRIDLSSGHEALATACIRVMTSDLLHFNVTGCHTSYLPNAEQGLAPIPILLAYSCLHWVHHLIHMPDPSRLLPLIHSVFQKKMLFWIEVLSGSGHARLAVGLLHRVLTTESTVRKAIVDAKEFVMLGHEAIEFSAPHIYLSVLPSLSPSSMIAATFWPQFRNVPTYKVTGIRRPQSPLLQMPGHTGAVVSVAFSPDGTRVVSGSQDRTVRIWNAQTGDLLMDPLEGHNHTVTCVTFSPHGMHIVSGSHDATIRLWNARTGDLVMNALKGHSKGVLCVAFSPDGTQIVSGSDDCTLILWDARSGKPLVNAFEGHTGAVNSVMFSQDGKQVVSCSDDETIRLWNVKLGKEVMEPLSGHGDRVCSVAFSPNGTQIVSGSDDRTIRLWDARTGAPIIGPLAGHNDSIFSVAFSLDGTQIVSGSADKTIQLWDVATGCPVMQPFEGHSNHVCIICSVAISPDGTQIISGSMDTTLQLWNVTTGEQVMKPFQGHEDWVTSVTFSADGARIVSGSRDKTIRLWNAQTGDAVIEPFRGHTASVVTVTVSPDGLTIASGSDDTTVRLWNAATGALVMKPLEGHSDSVCSVAFSPNGTCLASGSWDNTIRIWDVMPGDLWMRSQYRQGSTIWSTIASSFQLPVALQLAHSLGPDHTIQSQFSQTSQSDTKDQSNMLYFDSKSGWIKGPQEELIMWIPKDYWCGILMPRTKMLIGQYRAILDVSRFVHSDKWADCYTFNITLGDS
ncbi:hypothetical protein CERSUDRAFT_156165 [Gelatoporia subvermispora B]|uniref:NACHT domain-containing protein n=1 Tax=Ceriporiopsis subvermispora (strain B) TaxID=914234 RepID=M2QWI9_CERS8|nr:hypothetical protein CERSUDRAFT_156165 [Gelatoporia subvermispora B]